MGRLFNTYRRDAWGKPIGKTAGPDDKTAAAVKAQQAIPPTPPKKKSPRKKD